MIVGGERLNYSAVDQLHGDFEISNVYGVTESTVDSTIHLISQERSKEISIGKPLDNTRIYILDPQLNIQPIGVLGEICISGAGLARGYLNQPDLTAEKFIDNPYWPGERLYKTGI